ncbi:MAG: amidohydrolase, partial [Chitinophagaceae bacterium]
MLQDIIRSKASQYLSEYIDVRRHLHAHPELSYEEFETSKYVQEKLRALGIP